MAGARILVIKQECLREFVDAEPAFAAIRKSNPGVPVDLLTTPSFGRLAKGSPYFDRVLAAGSFAEKPALKELVGQLKRIGYEQVYDLDGTRATMDLKTSLSGFRGPRWVGPKRVLSKGHRVTQAFPAASMRKMMADAKIPTEHRLPDLRWSLNGRKDAANMQPSWFGISGPFALFLPSDDPMNRWPVECYASIAQTLAAHGMLSVILGGEHLSEFAQGVVHASSPQGRNAARNSVIDLTGKTDLAQLAMLAKESQFFVAGSSDTLHLCLSLGCPGVVLLHSSETAESEALFGRDVIKLTSQDIGSLAPDMVLSMLANMRLIEERQPRGRRVRA
ncbi:MAG: glycosyltransferase family 9 protein [Pseudomonadota bacterium]